MHFSFQLMKFDKSSTTIFISIQLFWQNSLISHDVMTLINFLSLFLDSNLKFGGSSWIKQKNSNQRSGDPAKSYFTFLRAVKSPIDHQFLSTQKSTFIPESSTSLFISCISKFMKYFTRKYSLLYLILLNFNMIFT